MYLKYNKANLIWWQKIRIPDLTNNCYKNAKIITNWAVIGLLVSLTYGNQLKR